MTLAALAFVLVNRSNWITDADLRRLEMALALNAAECATAWGKPVPSIAIAGSAKVPDVANIVPVVLSPTIDQPMDLAYHSTDGIQPNAIVLADQTQMSLHDVFTATSHEVCETIVDPFCDQFSPLGNGDEIDLEVCDPVEGDDVMYDIGEGDLVAMSDWATPSWFNAATFEGTKLDRAGLCTLPLIVRPGGYAVVVTANGKVKQIGAGPAAYKRHPAFRHGRRLAAAHARAMRKRIAA